MWRVIFLLFCAKLITAGTIEIWSYTYDFEKNKIIRGGGLSSTWNPPEKNRAVIEMKMTSNGGISFGVAEADYMYYTLREATTSEFVPFPKPVFQKRLRFIVDDNDKSITSDQIIFRFEETILVDSLKNLFSINYFALNKQEMHEKYGVTQKGLDITKIDGSGEVKMIVAENEESVTYWTFHFSNQEKKQISKAESIYKDEHSDISAPFVYAVQYQNYKNTFTYDRVSQDAPFTIPVAEGQYEFNGKVINYYAELYCIILPYEFKNDKLVVYFKMGGFDGRFVKGRDIDGVAGGEIIRKTLEFKSDDVIQIKLPSHWPDKSYVSPSGLTNVASKNGIEHQLIYDPKVGDQYITIRPIKIE